MGESDDLLAAISTITEVTTGDFTTGTANGTMVAEVDSSSASGQLRLASPFHDLFLDPSCGTRRMVETAAHLVDVVLPRVPFRQWVLMLWSQTF